MTNLEFEQPLASSPSNVSINTFYRTYEAGDLILRPPFQRNLVWNLQQQSFLVDSILRGLPVPEIYIQRETSAEGDEKTIVVDGQQRLTTCIRFLKNELRLVGDEDLDIRWRNHTFEELEEDLRRRFRSFELIARKLPDVTPTVLREVFRRLNKTVEALEPQELRHAAYTGPFVRLVEDAANHAVLNEIGVFSSKDYLRRRHDEFMGEAALAIVSRAFPNKKEGLDELFLTYEKQGVAQAIIDDLEQRFGRVFAELEASGAQLRRTRFRNKSDFYSLFVFLGKQAERLPLGSAARDEFVGVVKDFSNRVNDIKRDEADGRSIDPLVSDHLGETAVPYLRAVERAASDRLNRVRRDDALRVVLSPSMAKAEVRALSPADSNWRADLVADEDADDKLAEEYERDHVQEVLIEAD